MKYRFSLIFFLAAISSVFAEKPDSLRYFGEIEASFSAGQHTPFWLVNNLQGLGSPEKNNGYLRAALFKDMKEENRFSWGAGIDLVGGWNQQSPFYIHQLYGEVKYRSLGAWLGSKELWGNFTDHELSSGDLLYSGNALPVPQLRLGIFDYADVWGCNGWFSAKGYIAYGMFTDSKWQQSWHAEGTQYTKKVLYHSKGLWLRGGNTDKFPLQAEVGIEMATQFGGKSFYNGNWYKMESGFKSWIKAFLPVYSNQEFEGEENTSVDGNMMGAYNIAIAWKPKADWSIRAYYEHFFEDESQMTFEYGWKDGLYGIEVELPRNRFVSKFVYEYLYTKQQTTGILWNETPEVPEQISGRDDYYNNYLYNSWQHWGLGLGNPLVIAPIYNSDHYIHFLDNRIIAHHFGLEGHPFKNLSYRLLLSFSQNWGSFDYPLPDVENNFNGMLELTWTPDKFRGWFGKFAVAGDSGSLLGKSFGAMVSIGKTGNFGL